MRCKLITERSGRWSPRKSGSLGLAITICAATLLASGCGGVPRAGPMTLQSIGEGLKPEWSPDGQKIAFHRKGADGYYDVYIMNPDGSSESCLTCDKQELPGRNAGCASWHPSGNYLIFTAEKAQHAGGSELSHPGIGFNCDIWLMTSDGQHFWRLTDLRTKMNLRDSTPVTGVLGPHFSHDGTRVSWSERIGPGGKWGEWAIRLADLVWNADGVPRLDNIKTYQPGEQHRYYESDDFSPDDSKLLFCGNLISGQDEGEMDIYTLGLNDGKLVRLTEGGRDWNETGHFSPDGRNVVWLSNRGYAIDSSSKSRFWWERQKTDFWTMNADGSGKKQLTFYNSPGSADYESVGGRRTMSEYASWSPDGKRLAGGLIIDYNGSTSEKIVLIDTPR